MIRRLLQVLALIVGLTVGLAAALAVYGRMSHLRALAELPGWTDAIAGDARLVRGAAELPAGFALDWRLSGIGAGGPVWTAAIRRADARLDLTARLQPARGAALQLALRVEDGSATLSGPRLAAQAPAVLGSGTLTAQGLTLELTGHGRQIEVDGEGHVDGGFDLRLSPAGWRLELAPPNGVMLEGDDPAALLGE